MKFKSMSIDIPSVLDELGVVFDFLEDDIFKAEAVLDMFLFGLSLLSVLDQVSQDI